MTLTELRYIIAVARIKHFGRAAEECCVSQPTLSVGIRKLEDSLGISIFERGRAEVKITPIGQSIINQAQKALTEIDLITQIANASKNQLKDPIKIASSYTIGKYLFPSLVKYAYNTTPELLLQLSQGHQDNLIDKLINQEVDLLLLSTNMFLSNNSNIFNNIFNKNHLDFLNFEPVLIEDLYLLTAKHNKYSYANSLSIKDLKFQDLMFLNNQHCFSKQLGSLHPSWQEYKSNNKDCSKYSCHDLLDCFEELHEQVIAQSGITIIPALYGNDIVFKDNNCKIIPFLNPKPQRVLSLVWHKDFPRQQAVETVKQSLRSTVMSGIVTVDE